MFMACGQIDAQTAFSLPAVPDTLRTAEKRAAYLLVHYWDSMDFNWPDVKSAEVEQAFADFASVLPVGTEEAARAPFARALVDKLANFSFEEAFAENYDFFSNIFEYLIKDYNTAGGGKYAEYYTPHAIATIMARLLVGNNDGLHNIECYDPSAGTGILLMALSHQIGEDKCTIFAQDISQRSNKMLKLNLLLNGLVSSLDHAIQGDTLVAPPWSHCLLSQNHPSSCFLHTLTLISKRQVRYNVSKTELNFSVPLVSPPVFS